MLLKISLENFWYNMEKLQNIMTMIWYYPEHLKFCGKNKLQNTLFTEQLPQNTCAGCRILYFSNIAGVQLY